MVAFALAVPEASSAAGVTINFGGLSVSGTWAAYAGDGSTYSQDGFIFINPSPPGSLRVWGLDNAAHPVGGAETTSLAPYYDTFPVAMEAVPRIRGNDSPSPPQHCSLASFGFPRI